MNEIITVEHWPDTGTWRICVAGVAVGYWPTQDEAETRARQARRALAAHASEQGATNCVQGAHNVLRAFCAVSGCGARRSGQSPYCKLHRMRYERHGDPQMVLKRGRKQL